MKTLIIFSIAFLFCITAKTQEYTPFDFEKGFWATYQCAPDYCQTIRYFCKGDTLIDGIKYYNLYGNISTAPIFGTPTLYLIYYGGIRDNGNKQVILNDGNLRILYDFNLEVGDTLINGIYDFPGEITPVVQRIDSIQICGTYHKRYKTQYKISYNDSVSLIEGIGMSQCLLGFNNIETGGGEFGFRGCYVEAGNINCNKCDLISDVKNNYSLSEDIRIFPNPSNSILTIISLKDFKKLSILDLSGRIQFTKTCTGGHNLEINTKSLYSGYYILRIEFQDNTLISKSIIIK
jgi:hypothetical protein